MLSAAFSCLSSIAMCFFPQPAGDGHGTHDHGADHPVPPGHRRRYGGYRPRSRFAHRERLLDADPLRRRIRRDGDYPGTYPQLQVERTPCGRGPSAANCEPSKYSRRPAEPARSTARARRLSSTGAKVPSNRGRSQRCSCSRSSSSSWRSTIRSACRSTPKDEDRHYGQSQFRMQQGIQFFEHCLRVMWRRIKPGSSTSRLYPTADRSHGGQPFGTTGQAGEGGLYRNRKDLPREDALHGLSHHGHRTRRLRRIRRGVADLHKKITPKHPAAERRVCCRPALNPRSGGDFLP